LRGVEKDVVPQVPQTLSVLIPKGRREDVTQQIDLQLDVQAPVEEGQKLGCVTLKFGEKTLGEYALTAPHRIDALTVPIMFRRLVGVFAQ
jgi:D-alanyl-D-alanine carboxypeptidase (penicillin-binding protein 5/6)